MRDELMRVLCLGYGEAVAFWHETLRAEGWHWSASVREREKAKRLRALGVTPLLWHSVLDAEGERALMNAELVIVSAAPTLEGDPLYASIGALLQRSSVLRWLGYLSSTNVYGNRDGGWVGETTPPNPTTARGLARWEAERQWRALGAHVFRLAGIYGVHRNPLRKLKSGKARHLIKPGHVFNRIHEADIAQVLSASIVRPNPGTVYNLADDCPAPPQEVLAYAAQLCGVALPPPEDFAAAHLSGLAAEFYLDNKRVSNTCIKTELGVALHYPDYRCGLKALWRTQGAESSSATV